MRDERARFEPGKKMEVEEVTMKPHDIVCQQPLHGMAWHDMVWHCIGVALALHPIHRSKARGHGNNWMEAMN